MIKFDILTFPAPPIAAHTYHHASFFSSSVAICSVLHIGSKPGLAVTAGPIMATDLERLRAFEQSSYTTGAYVPPADPWSSPEDPYPLDDPRPPLPRWDCQHADPGCRLCHGDPSSHWPCSELQGVVVRDCCEQVGIDAPTMAMPFDQLRVWENLSYISGTFEAAENPWSSAGDPFPLGDPLYSASDALSPPEDPVQADTAGAIANVSPSDLEPGGGSLLPTAAVPLVAESVPCPIVPPPIVVPFVSPSVPKYWRMRADDWALRRAEGVRRVDPLGRRPKALPHPPPYPPPSHILRMLTFADVRSHTDAADRD